MAMAQVLHQANDTDCSVCHDSFKEPKILPCGHVVCRHCLVSWLRAQPQAGCPLCRCAALKSEGQPRKLEEEVGALPTDLALAELVEARALLDRDHTCCVCDDVAATALCLHCRDMLCASCAKAHRKLSVSKHHKVEDLSSVTPDSLAENRPTACSTHPDEPCKLFCPNHVFSVCLLCVAASHRSCPDLTDLKTRTEEARAALANMAVSLSASESELKQAIQHLDRHILDTEERVQAAIAEIQKTCNRLESGVKRCRGRMSDMARVAASEIQDKTREAIATLQGRKSKATLHAAVVKRVKGSLAPVTVSDMHSLMQTRVLTLDCSVTLPAYAQAWSILTFVIDDKSVRGVERALGELGRVNLVPADYFNILHQFVFHADREANVVLSNNSLTAKLKTVGGDSGIFRSRDPMAADVMYEVTQTVDEGVLGKYLEKISAFKDGWKFPARPGSEFVMHQSEILSVLHKYTKQPYRRAVRLDKLETGGGVAVGVLPEDAALSSVSEQWRRATLFCHAGVMLSGAIDWVRHPITSAMARLQQGDRVGVSVDTSHQLHLHVNGADRGVWVTAVTGACRVVICLGTKSQLQVTALLPTRLDG